MKLGDVNQPRRIKKNYSDFFLFYFFLSYTIILRRLNRLNQANLNGTLVNNRFISTVKPT